MSPLYRDRYVTNGSRARDLVTGEVVPVDQMIEADHDGNERELGGLVEALDNGHEGYPRWIAVNVADAADAMALRRLAAAAARRRGYVPVGVNIFAEVRQLADSDLRDRSLVLVAGAPENIQAAKAAFLAAAATSSRPHVLLTIGYTKSLGRHFVAREARPVYGDRARGPLHRVSGPSQEVLQHVERAKRAQAFIDEGRHAAAVRLLRDVAESLRRRAAYRQAVDILVALGRLLLERGAPSAADEVFADAAQLPSDDRVDPLATDARAWQAWGRIEQGRFTEAESLARAAIITSGKSGRLWPRIVLARCLVEQLRYQETDTYALAELQRDALPDEVTALAYDIHIQRRLAQGDIFAAGLAARALLDLNPPLTGRLPSVIAETARFRVLCAAGDLRLAEGAYRTVLASARCAHAPLRAVRAHTIWGDALRRAGRERELRDLVARLQRMARAMPPVLKDAVQALARSHVIPIGGPSQRDSDLGSTILQLVRVAHEEEDDTLAVRRILEFTGRRIVASRVEFVSADAGPVTAIVSVGNGLPTTLGERVIESGIAIGLDTQPQLREMGVPVRLGSQLLGALVCRWPVDRAAPPGGRALLEMTAAIAAPRMESLVGRAREAAQAAVAIPELLGISAAIGEVRKAIAAAARAPFAVFIEGESGVGKELVARAIHQLSARRDRRFVDVNCAALPDDLLESELFGHARGAFTGAVVDRPGLFEEANGGTLFLDEVAELSGRAQAKLLRVVQQQEIRRVGEGFSRAVDVRLVAAANRNMREEATAGRFRDDLLYRLDVIHVRMPPLRERPDDIPLLSRHFWRQATARIGSTASLTAGVLAALSQYHWPGNVRELQNVIAALAVAAPPRGRVPVTLLPVTIAGIGALSFSKLNEARDEFERRFVVSALARAGGNRTRAAAGLGLSRQGLLKTMARLGIQEAGERDVAGDG